MRELVQASTGIQLVALDERRAHLRTRLHVIRNCRAITVLVLVPATTVGVVVHPHPMLAAVCLCEWAYAVLLGRLYRGTVRKLKGVDDA